MTGSQTFPALTQQTIEEHRQIHFYLDQLARSLKGLDGEEAGTETLRRIAAQIEGLRERLVEHFATEEEGGLFRGIVEQLPESRGAVRELASHHVRALEMLEMTRIRAQYGKREEAELLRTELDAFLRLIREHEEREEALLAEALERERKP
jgi:hemerythrin-like domain-containing protein